MKKIAALATVFVAGMYGDNVWDFIRQWAPSLSGDGFAPNIQRIDDVVGATGIVTAIAGVVGLVVTTIVWCIAIAGDDDAKKVLRPMASITGGTLALCVLAAGTYVMIPDVNTAERERQIRAGLAGLEAVAQKPKPPIYDIPVGATLTIGDSTISVAPDGGIKVVQAKSN